jgi:hypothetical protein
VSGSETPHTTLRVAALRVLPGGTPDDPRAYYSFTVENDDERPPADAFNGVLTYVSLDGDTELFALGDTLTLVFGPPPVPVRARRERAAGDDDAGDDQGRRAPARPPDRESGQPSGRRGGRQEGSRRGG